MSELKFACPHCQQHFPCDEQYSGREIDRALSDVEVKQHLTTNTRAPAPKLMNTASAAAGLRSVLLFALSICSLIGALVLAVSSLPLFPFNVPLELPWLLVGAFGLTVLTALLVLLPCWLLQRRTLKRWLRLSLRVALVGVFITGVNLVLVLLFGP